LAVVLELYSRRVIDWAISERMTFKVEAIHGERFLTRSDAKYQVFDYIEVYYNRKRVKRLHSKLGYVSPETFEAKKVA
jgi:transposase InsO family protein